MVAGRVRRDAESERGGSSEMVAVGGDGAQALPSPSPSLAASFVAISGLFRVSGGFSVFFFLLSFVFLSPFLPW